MDWAAGKRFHFVPVERDSGIVLGVVGFAMQGAEAELSYWIRSDQAGRGLTAEACRTLIEWARQSLGIARLTLWAGSDNVASRRLAIKLGFQHVGPLDWQPEGGQGRFPAERYELRLA